MRVGHRVRKVQVGETYKIIGSGSREKVRLQSKFCDTGDQNYVIKKLHYMMSRIYSSLVVELQYARIYLLLDYTYVVLYLSLRTSKIG